MSDTLQLQAQPRERVGKGAARAARRNGLIPAVIYGGKDEPVAIAIDVPQMIRALNRGHFMSSTCMIKVGDKETRVLPREIQYHPVTDQPWHIDFLRVSKTTRVAVSVPVHFLNEEESPGLKRGGVLNIVRHEVEIEAPADSIPDFLEADLDGLDINDSVHISNVKLPDGVEPTITDRDFTIATIAAPSGGASSGEEGEGEDGDTEAAAEEKPKEGGEE